MMSIVCVLSIGLYLDDVGLAADQGWLVDGDRMVALVLPFDVAAAVITIGLTILASRLGSAVVAAIEEWLDRCDNGALRSGNPRRHAVRMRKIGAVPLEDAGQLQSP